MFNLFKSKSTFGTTDNFELIKSLVSKLLEDEKISLTMDTKFQDIGFDSIRFINLMLNLEDIINVDIETIASEIDLSSLQTLGDLSEIINKLKGK